MIGRISDDRFTELSVDYEAEQKELKERANLLPGELSRTLEATANAEKFMKVVRKYTSFEELTPTLLREFVEKIVIHESEAFAYHLFIDAFPAGWMKTLMDVERNPKLG